MNIGAEKASFEIALFAMVGCEFNVPHRSWPAASNLATLFLGFCNVGFQELAVPNDQPQPRKKALHWQILIAMVIGAGLGVLFKFWVGDAQEAPAIVSFIVGTGRMMGAIFMQLLRMVIVPLVFSSIIVGVSNIGHPKNLGRMGYKTLGFYLMTSIFAILIGLVLSNVFKPGVGVDLPSTVPPVEPSVLATDSNPWDILLRMVPTNPVRALAEMDMLGIIFFSILFGISLINMPQKIQDLLLPPIDAIFQTMMKLTAGVIRLAPFGVFGLILVAVFDLNVDFFKAVAKYMVILAMGLTLHLLVVLPAILFFFTKKSPWGHFRNMTNAMLTAFSTSSSSATLPVTMECVEQNAGVSNRISSFVLPLGSTVNMDGTALYECAGVLFIAQIVGADLTLTQQLLVVVTALLASIGAAGIPSAGLVMIYIVLGAVGLEGELVNIIVATMLAVDRPLDMYRTVVNIFSDSVGTVVIAHSEGEIEPVETS